MPVDAENGEEASRTPIEDGVGLGIDIVEIARMERILQRTPRFRMRVFTEGERAYCDKTSQPAVHYATRFAAKEAVLKALGTGFSQGIAPHDVEVVRTSTGRPVAKLHRKAFQVAAEQGVVDFPISLSFTHEEAVACAMAITKDSVSAARKRIDPMQELARQFREARAMLDDLPASGNPSAQAGIAQKQGGEDTSEPGKPDGEENRLSAKDAHTGEDNEIGQDFDAGNIALQHAARQDDGDALGEGASAAATAQDGLDFQPDGRRSLFDLEDGA